MGKTYDTRGTGEDAETICILKEIQEKCDEYIFLFPFPRFHKCKRRSKGTWTRLLQCNRSDLCIPGRQENTFQTQLQQVLHTSRGKRTKRKSPRHTNLSSLSFSYLSLGETLLYWWLNKCWQGQNMGGKGRVNTRSLPAAVRGFLRPCALPLPPAEPLSGVVPHPWSFEGFEVVLVLPLPPSAGKSSESAIVARKATYCESHLLARPHIKPLYKPTSQEPKGSFAEFPIYFLKIKFYASVLLAPLSMTR